MIPVLLDPWLLEFSSNPPDAEGYARAKALDTIFSDLKSRYPLEILPFIDKDEQATFWRNIQFYQGADRQAVIQWINALEIEQAPPNEPATMTDSRCPGDLSAQWRKVLAATGNNDTPPFWRFPMVFFSEYRKEAWPDNDEFNYFCEGYSRKRNLVFIEQPSKHEYFERDIDPWRLECVGEPDLESRDPERAKTLKRLPPPPQITTNLSLAQLVEKLNLLHNWHCGTERECFYLPPSFWNPTIIDQSRWRNGTAFPLAQVTRGRRASQSGYLDREGRIWVWHREECHWDVQINNGADYKNISHTGRTL